MSRGGKKGEGNGGCGCKSPLNPCSQWGLLLGERSENRTKLRGAEAWDYSLELIGERIFLPSLQPSYPFLPGQSGWPASSCSDPLTSTPFFSCFEWILRVLGSSLRHGMEVHMRKSWFLFQSWANNELSTGLLCTVIQYVHCTWPSKLNHTTDD